MNKNPIDVWLRFDNDTDEEATYEANTFRTKTGYEIQWYHNDVGQVTSVEFDTLAEVHDWYETNGYIDFSS